MGARAGLRIPGWLAILAAALVASDYAVEQRPYISSR
jgi:hypothetical protein